MSEFMRKEGVSLPNAPEDKPQSDPNAIPIGAKFTDNELANTLMINFVVAADMCAASASQSLRTDLGLMFLKFQTEKLSLGFKAKEIMQKKGWLKVPPFISRLAHRIRRADLIKGRGDRFIVPVRRARIWDSKPCI